MDLLSRLGVSGAILAASSIVLASVLIVPPEPEPEDSFRDVVFFSEKAAYALGDGAACVLQNQGELTFRYFGWTVQRLVGETWEVVECHVTTQVPVFLRPGEERIIVWNLETANPLSCAARPPVEPGLYRGGVSLKPLQEDAEVELLFAEFNVI